MDRVSRENSTQLNSDAQQLQGKDANPTDNALGITNSQTSAHAPSLLRRMVISVACTLLAAALGAGIAIAVMIFLLEMPIVLWVVVAAALGAASLAAGGIILWNVCSNKNDKKDSNPPPTIPQNQKIKAPDAIPQNQKDLNKEISDGILLLPKTMSSSADVSASKSGSEYESEENQPEPLQEETASETMQNEDEVTTKEENSPGTTPVSENLGDEKILNMPVSELEVPAVPNKENQEDLPEEIKSDKSTPVIKSKSSSTDEILNQPEEIKSNESTAVIKSKSSSTLKAEFAEEATQKEKIETEEISAELQKEFNGLKLCSEIKLPENLSVMDSKEDPTALFPKIPNALAELERDLKNMKAVLGHFSAANISQTVKDFLTSAIDDLIAKQTDLTFKFNNSSVPENDLASSLIIAEFNILCEDASSVNDILIWMDILHPLDETQVTQNNRNALLNTINCLIASYRTRGDLNTNTSAPVSESTQGIRYDEPEQAKETKESVSKSDKSESSNTDAALQEKNKNPIETARSSMDVNEGNQLISENEKNLTLQPEIESSNPQGGIKAASNSDDDSHKESLTKITPAIKNPDKEIEPNKSDKSKKIKEESENQPEVPAIPTDPMAVIHQPLYVLSGNRTGQLRTPIPDLAKTLPMNSPIFDLPNPTVLVMTDADFEKSLRNLSYDQPTNRFIENLCLEKANIEPDSLDEVNPALSTEWYVNKIAKFAILKDFIARCSNRFNDKKSKRNKQCEKCNELLKTMANNNLRVLSQRLSQLSAECGKLSDIDSIKLHANKFNTLCNDMADFDKTLKISNNKINHAMKFKNSVTEEEVIIIINAAFNRYEAKVKDHAPANMSQITPAPNGSSDGKSNSRKNAKQDGCIIQ